MQDSGYCRISDKYNYDGRQNMEFNMEFKKNYFHVYVFLMKMSNLNKIKLLKNRKS